MEPKSKFLELANQFETIVGNAPPIEKVKDQLIELKNQAKQTTELNYRQADAIFSRCDNYLNGTYGKTKTKKNLDYGKPENNGQSK